MIRLGTVGTGWICKAFLDAAAVTGQYTLKTVCSRSMERAKAFQAETGAERATDSLSELAESPDIDAVYIATPNVCHYEQAKQMLLHGKHVLCEKPMTVTLAEYEELQTIAEEKHLVYMEAMMSRHIPARQVLHHAVEQVGRLSLARIDFCQRSSRLDSFRRGEHQNIFDPALCTGTLMDLGVYCVYAALDLFGMPEKITADASFLESGADGGGCAVFRYPDFLAVLTYSKTGQTALGSEIVGENGTVTVGLISQYTDIALHQNGETKKLFGAPNRTEIMSGEAVAFADFIENPAPDREYAAVMRLCREARVCMDAIRTGAGITFTK